MIDEGVESPFRNKELERIKRRRISRADERMKRESI